MFIFGLTIGLGLICASYYSIFLRPLHSSSDVTGVQRNKRIIDKLMIVAHPDDELIFGGKELIKDDGWKVVCVTNGTLESNNIFKPTTFNYRRSEFISVMNELGCDFEIWDFEDNYFNDRWDNLLLFNQMHRILNERPYTKIVTHNLEGEYGHKQHKRVSKVVHSFRPKNLFVFDLNPRINNEYIDQLIDLLKLYSSQEEIINKHKKYVFHQTIKKVSFE